MVYTVGIVGYGHFGQFIQELAQQFFPDITIKIHSRRFAPDNETFYTLKETAQCDVVILCGSISEYESQLLSVIEHVPPDSILVDVATVKKHTSELLKKHCGHCKFISTHPMFGPESYKKHNQNVNGFRIVVTDYVLANDEYLLLKNVFASLGFIIIEMTADEHDERLAETLFLTHYVSQSILKAGFKRTSIDTLSFQFLMDAVESVQNYRKLFEDVYRYNPYCQAVAERLHKAQEQVFDSLKKD